MDREIINGAGDIIGMEEDLSDLSDLPEIDISDMEADAAEITYEQMKRERKAI